MAGKSGRVDILVGDITSMKVTAIVNAANAELEAGGGVCGAIHRAAGPELLEECRALRKEMGRCPAGGARLTSGYGLSASFVIHAVGPVWEGGDQGEPASLASAYRECLRIAAERKMNSVAFPAISTGIFGYPPHEAARVAVAEIERFLATHDFPETVHLVAFNEAQAVPLKAALTAATD